MTSTALTRPLRGGGPAGRLLSTVRSWYLPVVTAALVAVFVLTAWRNGDLGRGSPVVGLALIALNTVPLLVSGRWPLTALVLMSVAYPGWLLTGHHPQRLQSLPALAAIYAVGACERPLRVRLVGLLAPAWMLAASTRWQAPTLEIAYVAVIFVIVWLLGAILASRRSYAEQLEARTVALQAAQRELADRAVAAERARVARELHDIVAHAISLITVRAGIGAHLIASRPAEAAEALRVIEGAGREALSELRRMLAVLRDDDARAQPAQPQPGLRDVAHLIEQARASGVPVTFTTEGAGDQLSAGLDLAAYRVVQEALTNVAKHAPGAHAFVTVRHRPEWLEVEVRNPRPQVVRSRAVPDGAGTDRSTAAGYGLRGMAERVALYDGSLQVADEVGQFRVTARFPRQALP